MLRAFFSPNGIITVKWMYSPSKELKAVYWSEESSIVIYQYLLFKSSILKIWLLLMPLTHLVDDRDALECVDCPFVEPSIFNTES